MKATLLTVLRNKESTRFDFRDSTEKLAYILVNEASEYLAKETVKILTPIEKASGVKFKNNCMLVPILRSGMALLVPFLKYFREATVGFVGLRRNEKTAIPELYYLNIPKFKNDDDIIILDPMIATGGSAAEAIKVLIDAGVKEDKIIFVAIIASQEGLKHIQSEFPKVKLIVTQIDDELNSKKFIVPGLGDFGDRYFGTD